MARRPNLNLKPTTSKKVKVNKNKPKNNFNKMTPEMQTLKTFGIIITDSKKAKDIFNRIINDSKLKGIPIPLVAKEYKKNLNK
jgi:hypothetical protein